MLKSKSIAKKSLPNESKTGCLMKPPSLPISNHSTVTGTPKSIKDWLMSLAVGSPARTLVVPVKGQGLPGNDQACGLKWKQPFARYDPDTYSLKTAQCSLFGDSIESSVVFPKWGTMLDGALYPLPMSERLTSVKGSGLWATPRSCTSMSAELNESRANHKFPNLETQVARTIWQTPVADDSVNREKGKMNSRGEPKLSAQVKMFPTPTNSMMTSQDMEQAKYSGSSGNRPAYKEAKMLLTPKSRDFRSAKGLAGMKRDSPDLNVIVGGSLNPNWVEWLMGWPVGWSSLEPIKTLRWESFSKEPLNIPRVATGVKNRVNRLKAIGNGQVPGCAATAWSILSGGFD